MCPKKCTYTLSTYVRTSGQMLIHCCVECYKFSVPTGTFRLQMSVLTVIPKLCKPQWPGLEDPSLSNPVQQRTAQLKITPSSEQCTPEQKTWPSTSQHRRADHSPANISHHRKGQFSIEHDTPELSILHQSSQ